MKRAGGMVRRDLFDPEGGGYVQDAALLESLVRAKAASRGRRGEGGRLVVGGYPHGVRLGGAPGFSTMPAPFRCH